MQAVQRSIGAALSALFSKLSVINHLTEGAKSALPIDLCTACTVRENQRSAACAGRASPSGSQSALSTPAGS